MTRGSSVKQSITLGYAVICGQVMKKEALKNTATIKTVTRGSSVEQRDIMLGGL